MSLIAWLLESTGSFDKLRQGRFDEGSNCGWDEECKNVKQCIYDICTPNNAAYGGQFYDDCINFCNNQPRAENISEFFCQDEQTAQNAWNLYGYDCKNQNIKKKGTINILGRDIKVLNLASFIIFVLILYLIATKK